MQEIQRGKLIITFSTLSLDRPKDYLHLLLQVNSRFQKAGIDFIFYIRSHKPRGFNPHLYPSNWQFQFGLPLSIFQELEAIQDKNVFGKIHSTVLTHIYVMDEEKVIRVFPTITLRNLKLALEMEIKLRMKAFEKQSEILFKEIEEKQKIWKES